MNDISNWLKDEVKTRSEDKARFGEGFVKWKENGDTQITIDLQTPPVSKDVMTKDGKVKKYHEFKCLDPENNGKIASCTDYLYGVLIDQLEKYADQNCSVAMITVRNKKTASGTEWDVFVRDVK